MLGFGYTFKSIVEAKSSIPTQVVISTTIVSLDTQLLVESTTSTKIVWTPMPKVVESTISVGEVVSAASDHK